MDGFCNRCSIVASGRIGNKTLKPDNESEWTEYIASHLGCFNVLTMMEWIVRTARHNSSLAKRIEDYWILSMQRWSWTTIFEWFILVTHLYSENWATGGQVGNPPAIFQNPNSSYPILGCIRWLRSDILRFIAGKKAEPKYFRRSPSQWKCNQSFTGRINRNHGLIDVEFRTKLKITTMRYKQLL